MDFEIFNKKRKFDFLLKTVANFFHMGIFYRLPLAVPVITFWSKICHFRAFTECIN